MAAEIEDQGEKLSDNIKMIRIISSLSPKFSNFKTVWYNVKDARTIDNMLARLQLEEDHLNKRDEGDSSERSAQNGSHRTNTKRGRHQSQSRRKTRNAIIAINSVIGSVNVRNSNHRRKMMPSQQKISVFLQCA